MSQDAGCVERFLCALFATLVKPISDLGLLISGLCVLLFALCFPAWAQQTEKIPRIAIVGGSQDISNPTANSNVLRQGLRDLGYVEGKNILVELRSAEGKNERYPSLIAELVQLNVDVLVSTSAVAVRAAKQASKTLPIVMVINQDPVATGLVGSLAHPGGNVTGLTTLTRDLSGKRLELLTEAVPGVRRVGVLWDAANSAAAIGLKEYEAAARAMKVQLQSLEVRGLSLDLERAFQAATKRRADALITVRTAVLNRYAKRIAALAIKNRLPSMFEVNAYVEAGGLMSYANSDAETFKRAAIYVDKILKGTKPADLPVERPMKFEFVINLRTAKQIGLVIPPNMLARTDKVIR